MTRWLALIIVIGVTLRLGAFIVSPPSNSYDDHLEAVSKTIIATLDLRRLRPQECWECYQPPAYYLLGSAIVSGSSLIFNDQFTWKSVQAISLVSSIMTLLFTVLAVKLVIPRKEKLLVVYFSAAIMAVLPRAIYTSAMATNDALLEASVACALLGYLTLIKSQGHSRLGLFLIVIGTIFGCWTKQSGLILLVPLVGMIVIIATNLWVPPTEISRKSGLVIAVFTCVIAGSDEIWRFMASGIFLVSNQHYFPYAVDQLPGSLESIFFLDFRFREIYQSVFMSETTLDSFWTEIFSRFWFDYERRFFPLNTYAIWTGRISYGAGMVLTPAILYFTLLGLTKKPYDWMHLILIYFVAAFALVPVLQTIRYPYFSSMKAVFMLPGIPAIILLAALGLSNKMDSDRTKTLVFTMTIGALIFGIFHIFSLISLSSEAFNGGLSGPLWPLPNLR
jgi:4-amino-4-deoxy-L-arabinose transferase-like glycosyltransferase